MIDRRRFLAAAAATAAATRAAEPDTKLAIDGGTPVRARPLTGRNWGPQYYDDQERGQLNDVLDGRNPFRWNNPPDKVEGRAHSSGQSPRACRRSTRWRSPPAPRRCTSRWRRSASGRATR